MGTRHQRFWPEVPRHLTPPATSLWFNVEVSATRFPDKPCVNYYDSVLTFSAFRRQAEQLAGFLQKVCGVERGDRVALYLQNSPQFIVAFYAILRADAMVVPINPMNMTREIGHVIADSGAKVMFVAQDSLARVAPLIGRGLSHAIVACYADYLTTPTDLDVPDWIAAPRRPQSAPGVTTWSDAMAAGAMPGPHLATPEDLCVMPYTSGTTGAPKGCIHRHRQVMFTAAAAPAWGRTFADECALAVTPYFHVTGMQGSMNAPILSGATIVLLPRWDRDVAAALIKRNRVTVTTMVPTMVVDLLSSPRLASYDLSSLRRIGGGGAAMPEAIAQKLRDLCGLSFVEGYGLSETMGATHVNPPDRPKKQCLGIPYFNVDARVVNPDTLVELPPGETGEIISSGPQVFDGYWNNPQANASCFVELDGKRFFRTGDLGRTDEDGYFFLVDRLKRMINVAGFKVWPAEVESMLYGHPAIEEAVIIGCKDPRRGQSVKAVVVLKRSARGTVDETQLLRWAKENMAAYKVPSSFELAEGLPKSATGKIQWRVLQDEQDDRERASDPGGAGAAGVLE
jgi:fatty-acyl-CoA synthase